MRGHIIIEGLDKTGKSTLAAYLSDRLGMPIKKFSAPEKDKDPTPEYLFFLANAEPHILDRCYMSEMAYGPVMRGASWIDRRMQTIVEEVALRAGSSGVFCFATEKELAERFVKDREEFLPIEKAMAVQKNFEEAVDGSLLHWNLYTVGDSMVSIGDMYDQVR
jgi:thymidylate kinase